MKFTEFQNTRIDTDDLSEYTKDCIHEGIPGCVYLGCLHIEKCTAKDWDPKYVGQYYLMLGRSEYHSPIIEVLECRLYEWAIDEDYTLPIPIDMP